MNSGTNEADTEDAAALPWCPSHTPKIVTPSVDVTACTMNWSCGGVAMAISYTAHYKKTSALCVLHNCAVVRSQVCRMARMAATRWTSEGVLERTSPRFCRFALEKDTRRSVALHMSPFSSAAESCPFASAQQCGRALSAAASRVSAALPHFSHNMPFCTPHCALLGSPVEL